jgi:ADP-ribose pyrophosphatase YjhB (NUDIX family)
LSIAHSETVTPSKALGQIRPLALGLFRHNGALLAVEGTDPSTGERFCRPVGGEIEFGELASEALAREVTEELSERIRDVGLVGVLENRFVYSGASGHELVFVFDCSFENPAM